MHAESGMVGLPSRGYRARQPGLALLRVRDQILRTTHLRAGAQMRAFLGAWGMGMVPLTTREDFPNPMQLQVDGAPPQRANARALGG